MDNTKTTSSKGWRFPFRSVSSNKITNDPKQPDKPVLNRANSSGHIETPENETTLSKTPSVDKDEKITKDFRPTKKTARQRFATFQITKKNTNDSTEFIVSRGSTETSTVIVTKKSFDDNNTKSMKRTDSSSSIEQEATTPIQSPILQPLRSSTTETIKSPTLPTKSNSVESISELENEEDEEYRLLKKRTPIFKELIKTEESYLESLKYVVDNYLKPLKEQQNNKFTIDGKQPLTMEHIDILFSNIELIYGFNQLLLNDLKQRSENWSVREGCVGDIFLRLTPFLKLYTEYSNNYNKSLSLLSQITKKCKPFVQFIEQRRRASMVTDVSSLTLDALLIAPIQRIPRYILLLKDLAKHTSQEHPDYKNLNAALILMQEVALHVNDSTKHAEKFSKLLEIENNFKGTLQGLAAPHRLYIKDGPVYDVSTDKKQPLHLFLFNDMLVIAKPEMSKKYKMMFQYPLLQSFAVDVPETTTCIFWFKIQTPSKTWTFQTDYNQSKLSWLQDINEERDKQMEIEGAKILYRVLKKEEERVMLQRLKNERDTINANNSNNSNNKTKNHNDVNLSLLLLEKKKIEELEVKKEEIRIQNATLRRSHLTNSTNSVTSNTDNSTTSIPPSPTSSTSIPKETIEISKES